VTYLSLTGGNAICRGRQLFRYVFSSKLLRDEGRPQIVRGARALRMLPLNPFGEFGNFSYLFPGKLNCVYNGSVNIRCEKYLGH
jgi:hypothetical protein